MRIFRIFLESFFVFILVSSQLPIGSSLSIAETKDNNTVLTRKDHRLVHEDGDKELKAQVQRHNGRIFEIETRAKSNENLIFNYMGFVAFFAGGVIGVVTLFLGFGVYKFYIDNKRIVDRLNHLVSSTFDKWSQGKTAEFDGKAKGLLIKCENDLDNFAYFIKLRSLLELSGPDPNEIFPCLTPLCEAPKKIYRPLLEKIRILNINPEITKKAIEGLNKIPRD